MRYLVFIILSLTTSLPVFANSVSAIEVTPLIGYRFGGNFENILTATRVKLAEDVSYGLLVAWPIGLNQHGEVLLSHYDTQFIRADDGMASELMADNNVAVTYLHLGGNVPLNEGNFPLWLSGGAGASLLAPDDKDLADELRFSMNIGLNTRYNLSDNLSLTFGGRVYATFFNSDSAIFCDEDICNIHISNDLWIQSEVSAGLVFSF
ncbi:MAG: hypothetical protein MJK12_02255 [Colwellia sp.]|nr:hypothetical protein [Colwellia sp.]